MDTRAEGNYHVKTETQGECHAKTETEIGVMSLQAKECPGLPARAGSWEEGKEEPLPQSLPKGANPADTLMLEL